jgi:murein DD-endopeptidase MepM/ murein hydrolase activator NlpD
MKRRLAGALLVLGLCAAFAVVLVLPASAKLQTVRVQLADGSIVDVTVNVPPGTPLKDIKLPGIPVPPGTQPKPQPPSTPPDKGDEGGKKPGKKPDRKKKPRRDETAEVPSQPQVDGTRAERKRRHRGTKLRNPDGSPTRGNPTFFDALPGPARITGVPNFVIRKFRVPIFLLPIYQAAGIQYGIRWEILAAINEIETDYGRNLNVSTAGAVGWMQFLPSTWRAYGVDANRDGRKDPYNPVDAIFAAARYLKAAHGDTNLRRAIFAYNHADWYVDSVLLRARLIAGVPGDLVGSLTGLTEGRFPISARARYADDLQERDAEKRFRRGQNAARLIQGSATRRGINIYSSKGAPVVAVNDGVVKGISRTKEGWRLVLQDVYGNRYTYSRLGKLSKVYPVPKADAEQSRTRAAALPARDARPKTPASAGRQPSSAKRGAKRRAAKPRPAAPRASVPLKERLFAHPARPQSRRAGGIDQIVNSKLVRKGFTTFRNYFSRALGLNAKDVRLMRLRKGSRVIAGTILGRVGRPIPDKASHVYFEIRPAGRGAPRIDPKPILDGWKLLEATAIYRANGRNALYGDDKDGFSIGQILLLPKPLLERRVLSDERVEVYAGGRQDIRSGQIDRRVLATLEYLAESGMRPTVTSLKSGHGYFTKSGNVSHHSSGNAVDIAKINGVPIMGHQDRGGVTEQAVLRLMLLQGTMRPDQIISLLDFGRNTLAMGDHADHIHVGFRPLFGSNSKLGRQALAVLKPGQWNNLLERLRQIDNPQVPVKPSKFALPARPGSKAKRGD